MRFPRPLEPGDTIGVTAPSQGIRPSYLPRLEAAAARLRGQGFEVRIGDHVVGEGVTGTAQQRAAELTAMLVDPDVRAVVPPWGGELAIQVLDHLDWDALAAAEPTWLVGFSDLTTLMVPLTTRLGWGTLHGSNLMDTPYDAPDGLLHWTDVASADGRAVQRSPGRYRSSGWDDYEAHPETSTWTLDSDGSWSLVGAPAGGLDVTGRLIGGCIEVLSPLTGTDYADVPAFAREHADEGLVVYVEAAEDNAFTICRALHGMRMAGWFDHARAILVGRTAAPDAPGLTQREAVLDALGGLGVPIVLDVECGHVPPYLCLVNGALTRVVVRDEHREIHQTW